MGTSTDQIRQELTETREDLDQKIDTMESRLAATRKACRTSKCQCSGRPVDP